MKKKNKRLLAGVIGAAVVALVLAMSGGREEVSDKPVVRIGAILPLTGDMAHTGSFVRKGIEFAIDDVNKNPHNKFFYRAVFEDNRQEARQTVPLANKLVFGDRVNMLMTFFSASARAAEPVITANRIIGMHGTPVVDILDGVYNFTLFYQSSEVARGASEFANARRSKRVALALQQSGTILELVGDLRARIKGETREFAINRGERDFKMLVRNIKEWNPDIIMISAGSPEIEIFIREMRLQGVSATMLGLDSISHTGNTEVLEGFYILSSPFGDEKFLARFGHGTVMTLYAPYFYDAVKIFADATERAGAASGGVVPSGAAISAEIHKVGEFDGILGRMTISPRGAFLSKMVLYKIENGKLIRLKE
ncbi:MAG: ABC transporter substrate-binding protein [Alphaproteobacteria bacterium]|nr:ABC transporter substrate-binding protein [Alphaproteobacteria bacterium]